jgi:hypothetical protein
MYCTMCCHGIVRGRCLIVRVARKNRDIERHPEPSEWYLAPRKEGHTTSDEGDHSPRAVWLLLSRGILSLLAKIDNRYLLTTLSLSWPQLGSSYRFVLLDGVF